MRLFEHAAHALGYAQSSVTTQMQKLEEQYGVPLFERHGKKLKPTQAGETLIHYAQQILALHGEAIHHQTIYKFVGPAQLATGSWSRKRAIT